MTSEGRAKPWEAPVEQIVLYRVDAGWRYALAYAVDVADGSLQTQCETLEEAQGEVLALVEELTRFRYSAAWRVYKPDW